MKLIRSIQEFELEEPLEELSSKWLAESFIVKRIVQQADGIVEIVWYGWETNWRYYTGEGWNKLQGGQFVPCEEPIYETKYQYLMKYGNTTS